jgi:PAS domain S-box-containing protein
MGILDSEKIDKIKRILKWHPRGMTISDLASEMKMNRNLVAKYLDMLLVSGQVEMQIVGAAKVFFISRRVPISALLEFSNDPVIVTGSDGKIQQVNEPVTALTGLPRQDLMYRLPEEIDNPFMQLICNCVNSRDPKAAGEHVSDLCCTISSGDYHFRVKQVPTVFEDGSDGFTFIAEDVTSRKKYEEMLRISEARFRGLVQSIGEAIIGSALDGTITSWNPAAEQLYGDKEVEVLSTPITELLVGKSKDEFVAILGRVAGGEQVRRHEMRMTTRSGRVIDVLISISPILGESGAILGASSIVQDITGEKMEQYLRQHEDQYRTLVEDLNVGIYRSTGDPRGRFVWGNTALLNILGYHSISDLQDVPVINVFNEPDARLELLDDLRKNQFVKNRVLHLKKTDGSPLSVNVTALAEFDENRNVVFINGIVQDISHIVMQNNSLGKA